MTKKYDEKEIRADYRRLTKLLIEKKLTITTMESATSGQIASLITDTEGSSAVLKGGCHYADLNGDRHGSFRKHHAVCDP